jgi:hypothetical protein
VNAVAQSHKLFNQYAPMQVFGELVMLVEWLAGKRFGVTMEIGTHRGGVLALLAGHTDGLLMSIDQPVPQALPYREKLLNQWPNAILVEGDSHSAEIKQQVDDILAGVTIDLIFIDGDHSYEGVKSDYEMYGKSAKTVIFHDIDPNHQYINNVRRFWEEIKRPTSVELVESGRTPNVIYTPENLLSMASVLYCDPQRYEKEYGFRGMPKGLGGIGIL